MSRRRAAVERLASLLDDTFLMEPWWPRVYIVALYVTVIVSAFLGRATA